MSYKLLRRVILPNNTGVGAPFIATEDWYDTVKRRPFTQQQDSQTDDPSELAQGDEVDRYEVKAGLTRLVLYNGNGSVYTQNLRMPSTGIGTALALKVMPTASTTTGDGDKDACFDLTGQYGIPPYQLEVTGQGGAATGYHQTATSQLEIYPVRFYNLAAGEYFLKVTDQTGDFRTQLFQITERDKANPRGVKLNDDPSGFIGVRTYWVFNSLATYPVPFAPGELTTSFQLPYGTLVDAYLLPGSNGATWRQVYGDGKKGVYYKDTTTATSSNLALDNLILFNPDTTAEQNGGVVIEAQGGTPPLSYRITGPTGPKTNTTGYFDGLPAGSYSLSVSDSLGGQFSAPFMLEDRYRLWRYLDYDDLDSTPMRVEFWRRDYDGPAETLCLTDEPVILKSDGLTSTLGGQGDLPSVVGTSAEINVLAEPNLFESVVIGDDRNCRVDYYYRGKLHFRGYVKPDIYTQPLLDGLQPTNLVATDGLADLKDSRMLGHVGQRLGLHRPVLNTLLHCLSRCEISLPLQIYANRRDSAMSTDEAPELWATTNRAGYYDEEKDEPSDQRTVVDALAQLLGGTLVQRQGMWQLRSALEASQPAPGRAYLPAGTPAGDVVAPAASGAVRPPGLQRWHWLEASQAKQVRPGWKSLVGTTDVGWLKNAFWQGEVFNNVYAWLDDASKLRGTSGWHTEIGVPFPLVLQRVGEKGKDHSTLWPRSYGFSIRDDRYLISPPLPLAGGLEAVPALISFTGKLTAAETYADYDNNILASPTTALEATLPYEVVVDGHSVGVQLATLKLSTDGKDTIFEVPLAPLPSGVQAAVLRLYTWQAPDTNLFRDAPAYSPFVDYKKGDVVRDDYDTGQKLFVARRDQSAYPSNQPPAVFLPPTEWASVTPTNNATGNLLVTSVGVELRPQNATWDGEDNFRADGPAGNVRPTEPLKSYHADVPISAGLFEGNLYAFGKGVGYAGEAMTTSWSRTVDKEPSPLLEANTLDQLALRANPARLVPGVIRHKSISPPYLLDSVDLPFDLPGRRFLVGSSEWRTKAAETQVSLIEIGKSDDAVVAWPDGARITNRAYAFTPDRYVPYIRMVRGGGIRVRR